ncbi:hypothetical protein [Ferrovibrio sp.]|uniref:BufA2 family periplasmic bufferin-type metallophore n=1 Tax=Ferrovibrio sp. TaxID=1917215 RepID=UPI001B577482|nr:hypothetical protein [Ferrovibrio sp.]MBP7065683.1 hypothetical protein [Ferrovibrio sp.]
MNRTASIAIAAAAFFSAGTIALATAPAHAADVKCVGANACKGQSACKTSSSACKGHNACKGQGFTTMSDAAACTKAGGKVG